MSLTSGSPYDPAGLVAGAQLGPHRAVPSTQRPAGPPARPLSGQVLSLPTPVRPSEGGHLGRERGWRAYQEMMLNLGPSSS